VTEKNQPDPERQCRQVLVRGVVQGVGFRPFVYRLAVEEELSGSISNDTGGVTIEIEGRAEHVASFLSRLRSETPPLARIDSVEIRNLPLGGLKGFHISSSQVLGRVNTGIPADAATCPDCLRELLDPGDRRFHYPFLNCTNCGPRFTITRRIPYDRPQTSMARFNMCPACRREYDDPSNRRFHAQPNACWECGPQLWLVDADGKRWTGGDHHEKPATAQSPAAATLLASRRKVSQACVERVIELLLAGQVVAVKGIGGFHLVVNAASEAAVMRLRDRKHRYGKPLAVMVRDLDAARELCELTAAEEALLTTPARPIVLARKREANGIAPSVAPAIPWLGVYLPYAPLQHLLFADGRLRALVMTSANLSEEPIAIDNDEAQSRLAGIADAFLMHDREILQRADDSVAAIVDGVPQLLRRARGYVPMAVELPSALQLDAPPLLAVGGHMKDVFALARGRWVYQSQHLGDLENLTGLEFFRESLAHLMRTFEIEPEFVVHDLHPGYLSTSWAKKWAEERGLVLIGVQHHHAHVAGCMAEHGLTGEVIGLALDGTGYGSDGKIWGGEVLLSRLSGFERFAHLDYVPLPGGDAAVREPWRTALAHLHSAGLITSSAGVDSDPLLAMTGATDEQARILLRMIERSVNAPLTSSLGRLFDAVAAVVMGRRVVDYEAQAALELEGLAVDEPDDLDPEDYALKLESGDWSLHQPVRICTASLWRAVTRDLLSGVNKARIAARFHAAVAEGFIQAAVLARAASGAGRVALTGGCMHNRRLSRLLRKGLEARGFEVFPHRAVSPGDGGLSYGQAVVASALLAQGGDHAPANKR